MVAEKENQNKTVQGERFVRFFDLFSGRRGCRSLQDTREKFRLTRKENLAIMIMEIYEPKRNLL